MKNKIKIKVYQQDWMPGFAAYVEGSVKEKNAHILLNIGGLLGLVNDKTISADELPYIVVECLLHEFIHVIEDWTNSKFSERKVNALVKKYRKYYSNKKMRRG